MVLKVCRSFLRSISHKNHYLALCLSLCFFWQAQANASVWLGIAFRSEDAGLRVERVLPGSGAADAAIMPGDLITTINARAIQDVPITETLRGVAVGTSLKMELLRGDSLIQKSVILKPRPAHVDSLLRSFIGEPWPDYYAEVVAEPNLTKTPKLRVIEFFATWCGPCRRSVPVLEQLNKEFTKQDVEFLLLGNESYSVLSKFVNANRINLNVRTDVRGAFHRHLEISSFPTLFLVDERGHIVKRAEGYLPVQTLRNWIKDHLYEEKH
jgi:thiol-disulfide isomerase/thioredoxin